MNAVDIAQLIDKMRIVERKMGVVYTLFKSSVYAVTQQMREQEEELEQEQEQERVQEQEAEQQHEEFRNSLQYNQDQSRRRSIQSQGQGQSQSEDEQEEKEQYQQYSEQGYQQQQQQQLQNRRLTQPQSYNQSRRSLYPSSEESHNTVNNALRSSQSRNSVVTPSTRSQSVLRVSNANAAREEFQSGMNNNRSVLSVSRGYGSSRWSQGAMVRDSDNQTNRPRYY
ncbi:hypothetical protein BGZ46_007193 [Entomortierella lignicola]|nr:hypothetical protein BGZ46_007193 [Entomortierella lignicola]